MKHKLSKLTLFLSVITTVSCVSSAQAYDIFFGEDLNNSGSNPLPSFPNASAAESDFLSNLSGVGTEDFESFAAGTSQPLMLDFPGTTGTIEATLSGGDGEINSQTAGTAAGGRYGTSPTNFWEVSAGQSGNFEIVLDQPIGAFGFFGIDIGDFGGQLELQLTNGATETLTVPNTSGSNGSTNGSVIFYGVIAESMSEQFTSVSFLTSTGQTDVFAFDDLTIGDINQVGPEPTTTPEPTALIGLATVALAGLKLKKKKA